MKKAYPCFSFSKIKSDYKLKAASSHNARMSFGKNEKSLDNADPEMDIFNLDLMPMFEGKSSIAFYEIKDKSKYEGFNFKKLWDNRMCTLDKYANKKYSSIRKDAVLAIEIVVSFSNQAKEKIELDEWRKANIEWVKQTFNVAPDNGNNVISAIYHQDERTPHIHFIIVPIDEKGSLNSSKWLHGRNKVCGLHRSYDKAMESFGLEKSISGSRALKKDLPHIYEMIREEAIIPEQEDGENIDDYKERLQKAYEAKYAQGFLALEEKRAEDERNLSEKEEALKLEIKEEFERTQRANSNDINRMQKQKIEIVNELKDKADELKELNDLLNQRQMALNESIFWEKAKKVREVCKNIPEANEHFEIVIEMINNYDEDVLQKEAPEIKIPDSDLEKAV